MCHDQDHLWKELLIHWNNRTLLKEIFLYHAEVSFFWAHPHKRGDTEFIRKVQDLIRLDDTDQDMESTDLSRSEDVQRKRPVPRFSRDLQEMSSMAAVGAQPTLPMDTKLYAARHPSLQQTM